MHIQRKTTLIVLAVVALAVVAWVATRPAKTKLSASTAIPVRVVSVAQQDIPRFVSGIGSVLSLHSVVIRPQVDGILTRLQVKEGQLVKAGDLLASIDDRAIRASLDQARAQLGESQAQLQVAQVNLKRYKELSIDDGVSKQTYDQQQALVNQLKATVQGNQAAIDAAQVQLSYTQIRSPVSGRVGIRNVDEGNFLRTSDTQGLFSVTQIDPIAVEFSLPQQMLPTLQGLIAAQHPASVDAFLGADTESPAAILLGEGRLSLIDNQISATTGTIRAKAEFSNAAQTLWPGQLVTVKIQTALDKAALVVPPTVVQRGMDSHFVYRLNGDKVDVVPVQVTYQNSDLTIVTGVQPGDVLVSDGQSRLKAGAQVEVLKEPPQVIQTAQAQARP
ncbi:MULTISPECIES: efflux RND transporter periplasmic adaptor subunit [Pseudomonas]|jgi:RND family efflux transporter MFP subunit|uniref:Efflux RND transporter periplasmic adaptor subunit n=1 Tax=Pseudomonas proteolytica TaxID=219574 RepID=A0AAW5A3D7_9PSED|nr:MULTISPECIES: efflux RND transporter periplasmic adaptor subunit [Pseudomonas]KAA8703688.1 efflux RND transporter periplasmic adaptor subunit [Pseudomonas proteolytica]MCF5055918.1 efflux RND transporter periplasmic adaptor subunit [Pseudomonas proteolytica]MCF5100260.1 efflux RND transporter periplasmic adaptor subunit [Pseudomonas proteolytica]NMZ10328.1 efflux RND transporter periplasmic adaptor subunit [Pseudomonas proteolytica]OHW41554.1 efflux transporter periplasmic adaptor subunit [